MIGLSVDALSGWIAVVLEVRISKMVEKRLCIFNAFLLLILFLVEMLCFHIQGSNLAIYSTCFPLPLYWIQGKLSILVFL